MSAKNKSKTRPFAGIPNRVIEQKDWANLSPTEHRLITMFAYQYRGENNGKLCAPLSQAKQFGIKSSASLAKGLAGLLKKEYIQVTKGSIALKNGRTPVFYAVTWESIDEITGFDMDVQPTTRAYRTFIDDIDKRN